MAEATATKVFQITVDSRQAVQTIADYSAKIDDLAKRERELTAEIKESGEATAAQSKELIEIRELRKAYSTALRESSKEVQNNIKTTQAEQGSLRSLRTQLSNLTKQYDELSRAQRESAEGAKLRDQINSITAELKGGEEGTMRFFRNVGNYAGSLKGLFGAVSKGAGQALGGLQTLGAGATTALGPLGIALQAVVGVFSLFKNALTSSEELSMGMSEAFAFLQAGAVRFNRTMQSVGAAVLKAWNAVSGALAKAANWLAKILGKEKEWAQWKEERYELENKLIEQQKEENAITREQRRVNEQNADSELKIAKLRAEAADKVTYSARQRLQFIKEAADEERKVSERNYNIAKRDYELQKSRAALAGNSKEENEALSAAYTKMIQQETAYFQKMRELNAQVAEATNQAVAAEMKLAAERRKANEELLKDFGTFLAVTSDELDKATEQIEKDYLQSYKNRIAEAKLIGKNTLALEVEAKKAELDAIHQLEEESDEQFKARMLAAQQSYVDAKKRLADSEVQVEVGKWSAIGSAMSALSGLLDQFGEQSREAAIASKALALGEIAVKTGLAIAGGVAQAMAVPFPANLAAIVTTVATVLANITSAISTVKSAKFSTGGYVSGAGSGTSDSIPAMLSNGESVNNARSTSMFAPIYSSLNQMGGGIPISAAQTANQVQGEDMLARAFAKGMSEIDIRVGVDEIARVQNRVKVVENLSIL